MKKIGPRTTIVRTKAEADRIVPNADVVIAFPELDVHTAPDGSSDAPL